jgi:hypothetical protein
VIPSLDMVVARAGKSWARTSEDHYAVLKPFLQPIAAAATNVALVAPYPKTQIIRKVNWAPKPEIIRMAKGSDNWPSTWADDDSLFTAYGDGNGFEPFLPRKLSLGVARISGVPPDVKGINIPMTLDVFGDGKKGAKASGMLMVDALLYMLQRNVANSQLSWSRDGGNNWTAADWKFETSFGCPTFLNFGRNYEGARDEFVYVYSADSASAYEAADRMVLARVAKSRIAEKSAYEFFRDLDPEAKPRWTRKISERGAVFEFPGNCYRGGITYCAALKRYLWCQVLPGSKHTQGPRFQGGFGIYDAPEPWGPWTTVFFTEEWDVGPGETSSLPAKWMSENGKTMWLLFSGDDCFSVRKLTLELGESGR